MRNKYKQLTEQDRVFIDLMLSKRYSKAKIAMILKVHPSTIYREIKRNSIKFWWERDRYYIGNSAQEATLKRRKRGLRLEKDSCLRQYVHAKLEAGWSPYQIEGRLKRENNDKCLISHESIYHYIYADTERKYLLHKYLRRKLRIEFQRECDQSFIKQKNINNVVTQINNRPLKCLNFNTPNEMFNTYIATNTN